MIFFLYILASIALLPLVVLAAIALLYFPWVLLLGHVVPAVCDSFKAARADHIRRRRARTHPWE